jgi:uncharacterized protein (TIGR02001 family)
MKIATYALMATAVLTASVARAELSATITGTTDYDFRGVSQTADDPALQISVDYEGENGLYAGVWGSNVDFDNCCDENLEIDYYAGFVAGETIEWDFGAIYYAYPGANDLNYGEIYGGGTYYGENDWDLGAKLWASADWFGYDKYGYYAESNFNYALPWFGIGVTAHLGYTFGDGPDDFTEDSGLREYVDWWLGVNRSFGPVDLELRYVDTDLGDGLEVSNGAGTNDGRFIFSVSTTLPW